jgi:hypothetical protein
MNRTANIKNAFYSLFSSDRRCSNCKYLEERLGMIDQLLLSTNGHLSREPILNTYCSLKNAQILREEVKKKNCLGFQRKYGYTPARQKLIDFQWWAESQWKHHDKIIVFAVGTVLAIIGILVAKGWI